MRAPEQKLQADPGWTRVGLLLLRVMSEPTLYLVATPIGNLEDLSYRAVRILSQAGTIAAEDTRVTRKLLDHYDIADKRVIACHDHNERASAAGIVTLLERGESVALVSDAGMPVINDPGYRVMQAVREAGFRIELVPGPSAVLAALVLSGFPPDRFIFLGFPPRKSGQRRNWLIEAAKHGCTLILMEAPHRLPDFLRDAADIYGAVEGAVCREITKTYEETVRAPLPALAERFAEPPRGEIMVVIDGAAIGPIEDGSDTRREKPRKGKGKRRQAEQEAAAAAKAAKVAGEDSA